MKLPSTLVSALLVLAIGCKKEEAAPAPVEAPKPAEATAPAPAPEPTPAPAPAGAALKEQYTAAEIWTDVSGMSRMQVMETFVNGANVSGTVTAVKDDPVGEYGVELDATGGNVVELRFADFGKAAKDKKLKAGDTVSAGKCSPTNPEGNRMALVQCELK